MSNTQLTIDMITSEALTVLHQKLNFIGTINTQYDDQFAKPGSKIGSTLRIRMPNRFSVRTGRVMDVQGITEDSQTLTLATQKGVDMDFSMTELALSLDKFRERYIEPAMSVLAANIEYDAMLMYRDVFNAVDNTTTTATADKALEGLRLLRENLVPGNALIANLNNKDQVKLVSSLQALFHAKKEIESQYLDGSMGHAFGFDFYANSLWPTHTTGTSTNEMDVNGANQTGASVTVTNGGSKTLVVGDIITFEGCYRVHPETKVATGDLQQFTVTTAVTSSGTSIAISPSIVTSGPTQNVSASPTTTGAVTKIGTASVQHGLSMLYHKDAFTFVTADLPLPGGTHMAARKRLDNLSMRVISDYQITNDVMATRIDMLYGYKCIRPEWAVRFQNAA